MDKLVNEALDIRLEEVHGQLHELQSRANAKYELVLAVARHCVHALSSDLAAPPHTWQTRCGWRFAGSPGFRLAGTANFAPAAPWAKCARCWPPIAVGV